MITEVQDAFFNVLVYCRKQIAAQDKHEIRYICNCCILKKINQNQCPFYTRSATTKEIDKYIDTISLVGEHSVLLSAAKFAEFCQSHKPVVDMKTGNYYCRDFSCPFVKANHPETYGPSCPLRFTPTGVKWLLAYKNGQAIRHKKISRLTALLSRKKGGSDHGIRKEESLG